MPLIASVSSASVATKSAGVAASLLLPQVMSAGVPSSCCKAIKILVSAGCPTRVYISVPDAIVIHTVLGLEMEHEITPAGSLAQQ